MSLFVNDSHRRSRSKSPGRGRSRSNVREPEQYGAADATPQYEIRQPGQLHDYAPPSNEPITMGNWADLPPDQRPNYQPPASSGPPGVTYSQTGNVQYSPAAFNYTSTPHATQSAPLRTPGSTASSGYQYATAPGGITYTAKPVVQNTPPASVRHTPQSTAPHTMAPTYTTHPQYTTMPQAPPPPPVAYPPPPMGEHSSSRPEHHRTKSSSGTTRDGRHVVEMVPGGVAGPPGGMRPPPSPGLRPGGVKGPDGLRMDRLSVSGNRPDLHTIVPGGYPGGGGGLPPPSPLLEAYHGTYQSISPMPHAMMMNDDDVDDLPPLDSLSPRGSSASFHGGGVSNRRRAHSNAGGRRTPSPPRGGKIKDKLALEAYGGGRGGGGRDPRDRSRDPRDRDSRDDRDKEKRRVKIYDAENDALDIVEAMSAKPIDTDVIIDILPALTHDQMLELRAEYKRHCKVQGRGINIAKHIKLKTSGNFGKIAYVTALGKYEGEGYWANYWYQSNSAKRELLIEALMGRQNHEIREIKDAFRDKRYSDSLTRCMDKELKADKFRKAVLMALEGERQEESDVWPMEYRNRDVDTLYKAMNAREGGESTMLSIVLMRSDAHLREVLRTYERKYQVNFAREALRKSNNLVGEVIAHILNGVINRPARDSMLLHHALIDLIDPAEPPRSSSSKLSSSKDSKHERQQRYELLISRLVRLHWDRMHLMRVKAEYEDKYGRLVEEDLEEATRGDFREFCLAICQVK